MHARNGAANVEWNLSGSSLPCASLLFRDQEGSIISKIEERASYNGSIEASQASDVGSIPIARSRKQSTYPAALFCIFPNPRKSVPFLGKRRSCFSSRIP